MKKYLSIVLACLLGGCWGGDSEKVKPEARWGVYREPVEAEPLPDARGDKELKRLWQKRLGAGDGSGFSLLQPGYYDGAVFVANRDGVVRRLAAEDGSQQWKKDLDTNIFAAVAVGEDLVVVTHDNGDVTALAAIDGTLRWVATLKQLSSAIPAIGQGRVVIRTSDGQIISLATDTGEVIWQVQKSVPGLTLHGDSSPVITGDAVLVGLSTGRLLANNLLNGRTFWEADIGLVRGQNELERLIDADTPPLVAGRTLYAATYQGDVVALQLQDATLLWRQKLSTRLPMTIADGRLFVIGELGEIVAVNATNGDIIWSQEAFKGHGVSRPIIIDGRLIIGDAKGRVHSLDIETGELLETRRGGRGATVGIVPYGEQFTISFSKGGISTWSLNR